MEVLCLFVTFEGIDGSGKSCQSLAVFESISKIFGDRRVIKTHEPGGWVGGEYIREAIIVGEIESIWSEVLLFLADRAEHVHRVIVPALKSRKIVLCERYSDSTIAYQVFGKGFPKDVLDNISKRAGFPVPDMTFWLDVPASLAIERISSRDIAPDRFEKDLHLFEKISRGYDSLFKSEPGRFFRVDGTLQVEQITKTIVSKILERISA